CRLDLLQVGRIREHCHQLVPWNSRRALPSPGPSRSEPSAGGVQSQSSRLDTADVRTLRGITEPPTSLSFWRLTRSFGDRWVGGLVPPRIFDRCRDRFTVPACSP